MAKKQQDLPRFAAIQRFMNLPVVSSGVEKASHVYFKVKALNWILEYGLENAEKTVLNVVDLSAPFAMRFGEPINRIDSIMCKSLDIVEQNIPIVTYTPEKIYSTTKSFVRAKVEPVLKRADSAKQFIMLDDALKVADKYVDKYLPDKDPNEDEKPSAESSSQAVKTIRHVNHFSKKLQRRLTRRTIFEAKLLKKQGYDTVQCLIYFTDLLATDPKMFAKKMKAIWIHLSKDEPENQKPPENIEELIEMLSREGARRFVHLTNFVVKNIYKAPEYARRAYNYTVQEFGILLDKFIKYAHLEKAKGVIDMKLANFKKVVKDPKKIITEFLLSKIPMAIGPKDNEESENEKEPEDEKEPEKKGEVKNQKKPENEGEPKNIKEPENEKNAKKIGPENVVANKRERKMTIVASTLMEKKSAKY